MWASTSLLTPLKERQFEAFEHVLRRIGHFGRPERFASPHAPGVFVHQMTGPVLRGLRVGEAIIQRLRLWHMGEGIKRAMNVAALAILRDDTIAFAWC